ncbi:MAG: sulfatase-like hydrolase/transferase [Planctomycetaceae bacterium]
MSHPVTDSVDRSARILSAIVIWAFSSLMVAWFEFGIFWNLPLLLFTMNLSAADQVIVVWSLWSRTLLVSLPTILIIAASHWKNRGAVVRTAAWTWHLTVLAWLMIDCGLQCVTGASLWHYVDKAMMTEDLSLGGDVSTLTLGIQEAMFIIGCRIVLLFTGCHLIIRLWSCRPSQNLISPICRAAWVTVVLLIVGIVPVRECISNRQCLEQLHSAMAFRGWLFHPDRIAEYGTAAFGRPCREDFADVVADVRALCRPSDNPTQRPLRMASAETKSGSAARPNIVILLTESLRYDLLEAGHLPRLARRSTQAILAEQHFSASNCSELGAFACLYSRIPLSYDATLDQKLPSEACSEWKQLGYHRQSVCSCSVNFCRMNEFISPLNFDQLTTFSERGNPWHDNDRRTLGWISDQLHSAQVPQLVFSILMATHYDYDYPPEYDRKPPASVPPLPENPSPADQLQNRYLKAAAFLDAELDTFLNSVEDTNTIVVITGDHGESFLDDGFLCHGTRLSDIQSRTPLMIFSPNHHAQTITHLTSHLDLMPTLLDMAGAGSEALTLSHGRSLLAPPQDRCLLLTHAQTSEWQALLIHPDGRLGITLPRTSEELSITGFFDVRGRVDLRQQRNADEIALWKERLRKTVTGTTLP